MSSLTIKDFLKRPRGTQDIFPPYSSLFFSIYQKVFELLKKNNYHQVIFPTFERSELFQKNFGSDTSIVKEMYTFNDKKNRSLSLRPEGTLSVLRMVHQNNLIVSNEQKKFFYWANMFRYERPQEGRFREFWQLGIENVGCDDVFSDFETIKLANDLLNSIGLNNFIIKINHLDGKEGKLRYNELFKEYVKNKFDFLCYICKAKYLKKKFFQMMECELCQKKNIFPLFKDVWKDETLKYMDTLKGFLVHFNIPFEYDYYLVRGLDYYTGIVFEVVLNKYDAKKSVLGGGRYDDLYYSITKKKVPSAGFALGVDRIVRHLFFYCKKEDIFFLDFLFLNEFFSAYIRMLEIMEELRIKGFSVDYRFVNLKRKKKDIIIKSKAKIVVLVCESNFLEGKVLVRKIKNKDVFSEQLINVDELVKKSFSFFQNDGGV